MRKILFAALAALSLSSAHASFLQGPLPSKEGDASVGAFGNLYLDPTKFQVTGQIIYGLAPRAQLEARVGGGSIGFEAGGYVKYLLFTSKLLHGALHTGLFHMDTLFWDGGPIFGTTINNELEIYTGPIFRQRLTEGSAFGMGWAFGADMFVTDTLKAYAEFDMKVKDFSNQLIGGVRYFF